MTSAENPSAVKFKKEQLNELLDGGSQMLQKVSDTITGKSRWSLNHELVFREVATGRFFCTHYSVGATEYQPEGPWEYEGEEIEVEEVRPVERVVTVYEPVSPKPQRNPGVAKG